MDSAYYAAAVIAAIRRPGARFSVTVPMNASIRAAIAAISEDAWTPIRYPRAIWDDQLDCWISDAEVAEIQYTAFASKKGQAVTARLIVRRVRDQNKKAAAGQDELFPAWRYHAVFTDSPSSSSRPRASTAATPSSSRSSPTSPAARWRTCPRGLRRERRLAVHRGHGPQPGPRRRRPGQPALAKARAATIRRDLIAVAARTARHGRGHLTLHLPEGWHRQHEWLNLLGRRLRPARHSGLTSPEPGHAPRRPARAIRTPSPTRNPDKPQNTPAAGKPRPDHASKQQNLAAASTRQRSVDRGLGQRTSRSPVKHGTA